MFNDPALLRDLAKDREQRLRSEFRDAADARNARRARRRAR